MAEAIGAQHSRARALGDAPQLPDQSIDQRLRAAARRTLDFERDALAVLLDAFDGTALQDMLVSAARLIAARSGRVVVTGMGKSGLIGRKVSATLASTGTPSFFMHPADASHGDLGMITSDDVVIAFSWSGETAELSDVITFCHRFRVPLVAITGGGASSLARQAHLVLAVPAVSEACPNRLAPTSSTTVQLALGDALAVALSELREFSASDFHAFHPRGTLATQLVNLGHLMATGTQVPRITLDATILDAMVEMTQKRFGITAIVDGDRLIGSFTDGDLRRAAGTNSINESVAAHISRNPHRAPVSLLAADALALMNDKAISQIFVCAPDDQLIGIVHIHDILRAGVV